MTGEAKKCIFKENSITASYHILKISCLLYISVHLLIVSRQGSKKQSSLALLDVLSEMEYTEAFVKKVFLRQDGI